MTRHFCRFGKFGNYAYEVFKVYDLGNNRPRRCFNAKTKICGLKKRKKKEKEKKEGKKKKEGSGTKQDKEKEKLP